MNEKIKKNKGWLITMLGFLFGLWLYWLYSEGGLSLMLADAWKGLLLFGGPALVLLFWERIVQVVKK